MERSAGAASVIGRLRRICATGDNVIVNATTGFVTQAQIDDKVAEASSNFTSRVDRIRYNVGADTAGDPAIFFRIVLSDAYTREPSLAEVTDSIVTTLFETIRPYENWGLIPYVSFRSKSEQALREDPEWT